MSDEAVRARIRAFLCAHVLFVEEPFPWPDEASLLRAGVLDSMAVMDLVGFVQDTWKLAVEPDEVVPANFDSVERLAAFVVRRSGSPG